MLVLDFPLALGGHVALITASGASPSIWVGAIRPSTALVPKKFGFYRKSFTGARPPIVFAGAGRDCIRILVVATGQDPLHLAHLCESC